MMSNGCPKCQRGGTGPHPPYCSPAMRFWQKVRITGSCWEWQGADNERYGIIRLSKSKRVFAHRWIYEQVWGEIPDGQVVMHLCDNPRCVRPAHLSVGTQRDNLNDAASKGRMTQWRKSA